MRVNSRASKARRYVRGCTPSEIHEGSLEMVRDLCSVSLQNSGGSASARTYVEVESREEIYFHRCRKSQRERRHRVRVGNDSVEIEERWEIGGFCDCFWQVTWVIILILVLIILVLMLKMVKEEEEEEQYEQKSFPPF
jgi:hypothetical protein